MPKTSAGILMYRKKNDVLEVLLAHPGGPFFAKKDDGVWGIPKGETNEGEDIFAAAKREFKEETGLTPEGNFIELGTITNPSGKIVHIWALEGDCDPAELTSNTFTMEWPPYSGQHQAFPENDRYGFFTLDTAREKIVPAQIPFIESLN